MIARITTTRRRIALAGSGVLLLGTAAVTTAAAVSSGSATHPPQHSHPHADYLDDPSSNDPCAQPPAQRTGGWACPAESGK